MGKRRKKHQGMSFARWLKNSFWYVVVMLAGIGYVWLMGYLKVTLANPVYYGGFLFTALVLCWLVAKLRTRLRF